jgi:16S rRNA (adenine1518-N6/adenine1519-N6)-dimethyltransferase
MQQEFEVNVVGRQQDGVNSIAMTRSTARPAKRPKLGQNFLADQGVAQKIVAALGDVRSATVIEIGPGRAVLTDLLASRAGRLIAIELDRVLAAQLSLKFARRPNVEIIEADVLTVDIANLIKRKPDAILHLPQAQQAKVIGNLPYYITSDILLHLFRFHEWVSEIVIMVQREVAERIAAKPGTRDYGLLSATAQLHARVENLFTLPPAAFSPAPKVHSSVLRLTMEPRFEELGVSGDGFVDFLRLGFGQKRKTLLNNLKETFDAAAVRAALKSQRLREDVRAEAVPLEKAAGVFHSLTGS